MGIEITTWCGILVRCIEHTKDRYDRVIATCYSDELNVNAWMVGEGHALAYRRYSTRYLPEEEAAQKEAKGIHAGEYVKPWDWRLENPRI